MNQSKNKYKNNKEKTLKHTHTHTYIYSEHAKGLDLNIWGEVLFEFRIFCLCHILNLNNNKKKSVAFALLTHSAATATRLKVFLNSFLLSLILDHFNMPDGTHLAGGLSRNISK